MSLLASPLDQFALDPFIASIAAPTIALASPGGNDGVFFHTRSAELIIDDGVPVASDVTRRVVIIFDGSTIYSGDSYPADLPTDNGNYIVTITDTNTAGESAAASISFVLDTIGPLAPALSLATDSGVADDLITNDPTLVVRLLDTSARAEFALVPRLSGAIVWGTLADLQLLLADASNPDGSYTVLARQTDLAGNTIDGTFTFTLDRTAPAAPVVSLTEDTGIAGDRITTNEALTVTGTDIDSSIEFRFKLADAADFTRWSEIAPAHLANGQYIVEVRATDLAGNVSDVTSLAFEVLRDLPTSPTAVLGDDTGASTTDLITNTATLDVNGLGEGAHAQFSFDGGTTWLDDQPTTLDDGVITVLVRQIDADNNASPASDPFTFTLDTVAPGAVGVVVVSTADVNGNGIADVTLDLSNLEVDAVTEFSLDGIVWSTAQPSDFGAGDHTLFARQTDIAGNISSLTSVDFAVSAAPTASADPVFVLTDSDGRLDGASGWF